MARYTNSGVFSEGRVQEIANRSPNVDILAMDLRILAKNIHAVFLFEDASKNLLRKLCVLVGTAAEGKLYCNWMHFADNLGVRNNIVKNIGNWLKPAGGPVEHVLLAYVQENDAMLDRLIYALQKMKRDDVIFRIDDDVRELVASVHSRPELKDVKGVYRLQERPFVPRILEAEKENLPVNSNNDSCQISYVTEQNNNGVIKVTREQRSVAMTVMLTSAKDGTEAEKRIAKKLRSLWPKIGVVVLGEQQEHLWAKHRVFILDCIKQVDIVMPVLTKGYFEAINGRVPDNGILSMFDVNQQYVKYIYDSLSLEYQNDGCRNNRIRCILPNNVTSEILEINPEITTYFGEADLEQFIRLMLAGKEKKLREEKQQISRTS